jgi:hypothetical protein
MARSRRSRGGTPSAEAPAGDRTDPGRHGPRGSAESTSGAANSPADSADRHPRLETSGSVELWLTPEESHLLRRASQARGLSVERYVQEVLRAAAAEALGSAPPHDRAAPDPVASASTRGRPAR